MLSQIFAEENPDRIHPVMKKDEVTEGVRVRYGFPWNAYIDYDFHQLLLRRDGCGLLDLGQNRFIWVFGKRGAEEIVSTRLMGYGLLWYIHMFAEGVDVALQMRGRKEGNLSRQLFYDAVFVWSAVQGHNYEDALRDLELGFMEDTIGIAQMPISMEPLPDGVW